MAYASREFIMKVGAAAAGGTGGLVLVGGAWSTLPGFTDQSIPNDGGYHGVFHDLQNFANGVVLFDGTNVGIGDASAQGSWHYAASGKIVGSPTSGKVRVVIAGSVYAGSYAGELARQVFKPSDFDDFGFVGYHVFAHANIAVGDNMGVYIVQDTDVTLTIEQGDPNDGSGPPACTVESYLLNFLEDPAGPPH